MTHNKHAHQLAYVLAKAQFDVIDDELEALTIESPKALADKVEAEWEAALLVLEGAETALIQWCWSVVENLPGAESARPAYDAALEGRPGVRYRIVDLACRLAA